MAYNLIDIIYWNRKRIEKEYDLKKFIAGKKIIKINETIKNINSKNVEEKFMGVDVDKQIIHKIKYLLLAKEIKWYD